MTTKTSIARPPASPVKLEDRYGSVGIRAVAGAMTKAGKPAGKQAD